MAIQFTNEEAEMIGEALGLNWDEINKDEFVSGMNVELEHGTKYPDLNVTNDDPYLTAEIALAHLRELPDYYTRLDKMEKAKETTAKTAAEGDVTIESALGKLVNDGINNGDDVARSLEEQGFAENDIDRAIENWNEGKYSLMVDGTAGIYAPQEFLQAIDLAEWGLDEKDESVQSVLNGPDDEFYFESWDDIAGSAGATFDGKKWTIYEREGDIFIASEDAIYVD